MLLFLFGRSYILDELKPNLNYRICSVGHMYSRIKEVKNTKNIDVLFLGSSHAYRGFDTRIFKSNSLSSFNLGSRAQTPIQTRVLLRRYINDLNPKLLIYEVYPLTLVTIDGVESSLDIISNDKNDFYSFEMALNMKNMKTFNTFLYAFNRDFFNLNASIVEKKIKKDDVYIKGGYVQKKIKKYFVNKVESKKRWFFDKKQLLEFNKISLLLKEKNKKVIFVYAPITSNLYNSYTNNKEFDKLIKSYGKYYNFNELMRLNDTLHFFDSNHLNQKGVELFNKSLIGLLKKNKDI
jgi:hypothetical protein